MFTITIWKSELDILLRSDLNRPEQQKNLTDSNIYLVVAKYLFWPLVSHVKLSKIDEKTFLRLINILLADSFSIDQINIFGEWLLECRLCDFETDSQQCLNIIVETMDKSKNIKDITNSLMDLLGIVLSVRSLATSNKYEYLLNYLISQGVHSDERNVLLGDRSVNVGGDILGNIKTGNILPQGDFVEGNKDQTIIYATEGSTVFVDRGQALPVKDVSTLSQYLDYVVGQNKYLQLQGIRSEGKLVHIEIEQVYITLHSTQPGNFEAEKNWLEYEASLAPGEKSRHDEVVSQRGSKAISINVNQALKENRRLVVLGSPGSGKTTLLKHLAMTFARDYHNDKGLVMQKLNLVDDPSIPVFISFKKIASFLQQYQSTYDGTEGHAIILDYVYKTLENEKITLPNNFFESYLRNGNVVVLFDGLDEIPDKSIRRRISRLVESFARAYPMCRYVVTSRLAGYTGASRLGENFVVTTVRDFTLDDIKNFLYYWNKLIALQIYDSIIKANKYAKNQTSSLVTAIKENERVKELAINPLMLTVIALVHRDRVTLPDRRSELYTEAISVLLGNWDEARGIDEVNIFPDTKLNVSDKKMILQDIALFMHERELKEISSEDIKAILEKTFKELITKNINRNATIDKFLEYLVERAGILVNRGDGLYSFSHLTFQEYLAALAISYKDDYINYVKNIIPKSWWREVLLLLIGIQSTNSSGRFNMLLKTIINFHRYWPENLFLAADALYDAGIDKVDNKLKSILLEKLQKVIDRQITLDIQKERFVILNENILNTLKGLKRDAPEPHREIHLRAILLRAQAAQSITKIDPVYWEPLFGEPKWIKIPKGEFQMGSKNGLPDEKPEHNYFLDDYLISPVPISNMQYYIFVRETGCKPPKSWRESKPPKELLSYPVVTVSWGDALSYCKWLSKVTNKNIRLPSEAQWEKAAKGGYTTRSYPWGNRFSKLKCNSQELGLDAITPGGVFRTGTTPVGIFADGKSPYGLLDMAGNVWEWTCSLYNQYPYKDEYERHERAEAVDTFVLKGGAYYTNRSEVRSSTRYVIDTKVGYYPEAIGFRPIVVFYQPK